MLASDNNNDPVHKKASGCFWEQIPARHVLYLLSWSGFLVSFMMRTDINFTIVAMVQDQAHIHNATVSQYCYDNATLLDHTTDYGGTLDWSPQIQSYVLASFYWAYIVSQVVGGVAAQKYGTKRVFGYAQLATALGALCIPSASDIHYGLVIGIRVVQGFSSGFTFPAMYALVGRWIPSAERSRFMSSFQGFSIGIGATYVLCAFIIVRLGWKSVFYTTGLIGMIWCVIWYLLAFDSPDQHPRITPKERLYITNNTYIISPRQTSVPWSRILTSKPAWAIAVTTFGRIWVHYTFIIPGPKYMKNVLGFDIEKNGILSGAPFICSYLASVACCYLADYFVTSNIFTLKTVRRIFTVASQVLPGSLCFLIGNVGCNIEAALVLWFIAITMITAAYAGAMANIVDIAPNFAGPVLAFAQTVHMSASFLSPLMAGYLLSEGDTLDAWRNVFNVAAVVSTVTYIVYQIWGSVEVQAWNCDTEDQVESEIINGK